MNGATYIYARHISQPSINAELTEVWNIWSISCEITRNWIPQDHTDDYLLLALVMAWCCQAWIHYLSKGWPRSVSPYCLTMTQWDKTWYIVTKTIQLNSLRILKTFEIFANPFSFVALAKLFFKPDVCLVSHRLIISVCINYYLHECFTHG